MLDNLSEFNNFINVSNTNKNRSDAMNTQQYAWWCKNKYDCFIFTADSKLMSPINSDMSVRLYGGRSNTMTPVKMNGPSSICSNNSEDDQRSMGCKCTIIFRLKVLITNNSFSYALFTNYLSKLPLWIYMECRFIFY